MLGFRKTMGAVTTAKWNHREEGSSIEFDAKTSILRMMVYRPVGEIFEKRSMRVCEVEERWVEARLNP